MKRVVVGCAVALLVVRVANAQPSLTLPQPSAPGVVEVGPAARDAPAPRLPGEVSADAALSISLGGTLVSWGVFAVGAGTKTKSLVLTGLLGTLLMPSAGSWYAGEVGGVGLGIRAAALATVLYGVSRVAPCDDGCADQGTTAWILLAGAAAYATGTIVDLVAAPSAAHRHNRALRALSVAPALHASGAGLVLGGRF